MGESPQLMAIDSIIAEELMQHLLMCDVGEMDLLKSMYCNLCVVWSVWYNDYAISASLWRNSAIRVENDQTQCKELQDLMNGHVWDEISKMRVQGERVRCAGFACPCW